MRRFKGECEHFSFNKCPSYTHDGANAKFSTNSHETDYSVEQSQCGITHKKESKRKDFYMSFSYKGKEGRAINRKFEKER
jgi:hypothetical protein